MYPYLHILINSKVYFDNMKSTLPLEESTKHSMTRIGQVVVFQGVTML